MAYSRKRCRFCLRPAAEAGHISRTGQCEQCSEQHYHENHLMLTGRMEAAHAVWQRARLRGVARALGLELHYTPEPPEDATPF